MMSFAYMESKTAVRNSSIDNDTVRSKTNDFAGDNIDDTVIPGVGGAFFFVYTVLKADEKSMNKILTIEFGESKCLATVSKTVRVASSTPLFLCK